MFTKFDISIKRNINPDLMLTPDELQSHDENYEEGEEEAQSYRDVCRPGAVRLEHAIGAIADEKELLTRIASLKDDNRSVFEIANEHYQDGSSMRLFHIGVGGLVHALLSIGCILATSGDGDGAEDDSQPSHPWVEFHAPKNLLRVLLDAAEHANTGLTNGEYATLVIFSDDVRKFNQMATYLVEHFDHNSKLLE